MEVITIESEAYKNIISEINSLKKLAMSNDQDGGSEFKVYNNQELGALLNVTPRFLQNCRNKGKLSYSQIGRRIIYTQEHVDEFIRNNEQPAYRYKR